MVEDHQHEDHQHGEHHGGIGKYLVVLVALCVLTTCSFLTYFEFWDRNFSCGIFWKLFVNVLVYPNLEEITNLNSIRDLFVFS